MRRSCVLATCLVIACFGCKNPYTEFYTDSTGGKDLVSAGIIGKLDGDPEVVNGGDVKADHRRFTENGYLLLGSSNFSGGGTATQEEAVAQGRAVNANIVVLYDPKYEGSQSATASMPTPTVSTTVTQGSATAYGSAGSVTAYGRGTSTTYGTQWVDVPFTVHRYEWLAVYWAKDIRTPRLGAIYEDLVPEERAVIGSNKGVSIKGVVKGTPAFGADMLAGDIIRKIGDTEILDSTHFSQLLDKNAGKTVQLEFIRKGITKTVQVTLNP